MSSCVRATRTSSRPPNRRSRPCWRASRRRSPSNAQLIYALRFLKHLSSFMDHNGCMNRRHVISIAVGSIIAALGLLSPQFCGAGPAANLHGTGIVYLHGKGSWPGGLDGGTPNALKEEGALVASPEMPW